MLNRYAAAGMVAEARKGRRILVVGIHGMDARESMDECMRRLDEAHARRVSRANGAERIDFHSGGCIVFRSIQGHGHRGISVDTVYVDSGADEKIRDPHHWDSIRACVASSTSAEIIRA